MKKQVTILLFCILFLTACAGSDETLPAEQVTPSITESAAIENTATSVVKTEAPTAVVTTLAPATLTPTTTVTSSPTTTAPATQTTEAGPFDNVVYATLSEDEATQLLIELLQTNGGCRLPCWWGIVLGSTAISEIESVFVPLGFDWFPGFDELHDTTAYKASLYLHAKESIVWTIEVRGGAGEETYDKNEAWRPYALPNLLSEYGIPSEVYVYYPFRFDPGGLASYRLFLYYPEQGIEIDYLGIADLLPDRNGWAEACPDILQTDQVNLLLFQPGTVPEYRELTLPAISIPVPEQPEGTDPYDLISWEQATESTLDAFYQHFTESEEGTVCFSFKTYWTGSSE
ncbi:MAG: hypothetical protein KDE34_20140 [Anaerolineales bacterium]|nr:hypothetical protein [Anaerolineales bacterium]